MVKMREMRDAVRKTKRGREEEGKMIKKRRRR